MKVKQLNIKLNETSNLHALAEINPNLVLIFGSREQLVSLDLNSLQDVFKKEAIVCGCSTAGEICDTEVLDNSISVTAIHFEKTKLAAHQVTCSQIDQSYESGKQLGSKFDSSGLKHIFLISEGLTINGSALIRGLIESLPSGVSISGGLSADGALFKSTVQLSNYNIDSHQVIAIGFYGNEIEIGCSSLGGWDPFGPERKITFCDGNILYELDGEPALELYKKYLGDLAIDLPSSGLLFPLTVKSDDKSPGLVRTLLAVDEKSQSLIFAGDLPKGGIARLMKANFDRLIDGAMNAASSLAHSSGLAKNPDLAILISCVGRKLILKQRVEEEVEAVRDVFGDNTYLTGFYSYGEISPGEGFTNCQLHNQTMTITTFSEI